jgi:hypothetical protein
MNERILQLRDALAGRSQDLSLRLKLVQAYLDYASSGLLDSASVGHYLRMGSAILDEVALPSSGENGELWLQTLSLRGQAARLRSDAQREEQVYAQILEHRPDHPETLGHLCALLFRQRRVEELQRACSLLIRHTGGANNYAILGAARLWSLEPQSAEGGAAP